MAPNHILLAAGGTGGHVFPAIAIGTELRARGCKIQFHTDERGKRLLASKSEQSGQFSIYTLPAASPFAGSLPRRVIAISKLTIGTIKAGWHMIWHRPQVVLGFGGYASAPSLLAASLLRIPSVLHEQNGRIGRANQLLARLCGHLLLSWQDSRPVPPSTKTRLTGLPVDSALYQIAATETKADTDSIMLHIQGGSLGARIFSQIVPEAIGLLPASLRARLTISQQTRSEDRLAVSDTYKALGITAELSAFFDDIPDRLAAADLIMSRSGAASTAEIAAAGKAAIFIPFAAALDDHQTANAEVIAATGGAIIMAEADTTPAALASMLELLLTQPKQLAKMGTAARTASQPDATNQIIAAVSELAQSKSWRDA